MSILSIYAAKNSIARILSNHRVSLIIFTFTYLEVTFLTYCSFYFTIFTVPSFLVGAFGSFPPLKPKVAVPNVA